MHALHNRYGTGDGDALANFQFYLLDMDPPLVILSILMGSDIKTNTKGTGPIVLCTIERKDAGNIGIYKLVSLAS